MLAKYKNFMEKIGIFSTEKYLESQLKVLNLIKFKLISNNLISILPKLQQGCVALHGSVSYVVSNYR